MAHVLLDRAKVVATSMSGNTSNYALTNAPPTGFVDFTGVGDGNTTYYTAVDDAGNWEVGLGTFATSGEVLTRTDANVIKSTNSNNRVSWPSSSTPTVFISQPADKAVSLDGSGDVTLTGANQNLVWDKSDDQLEFNQAKIDMGSGKLQIYDNGHSYFVNDTASMNFNQEAADQDMVFRADNGFGNLTTYIRLDGSETTVDIVEPLVIEDDATFTGASYNVVWDKSDDALEFADNAKATFGTGADLTIRHDSTNNHSYIEESGSGSLVIKADDLYLQNAAGTANTAFFQDGGEVQLRYNNSTKIQTNNTGVNVTGTAVTDGLTVADNTDATTILGRAKIASPSSDIAYFSHYDFMDTNSYALAQTSTGLTALNSHTGQNIYLNVNDTNVAQVTSMA